MTSFDDRALFRVVRVPLDVEKPRPCDIEVSSDRGVTWATLWTTHTAWFGDTLSVNLPVQLAEKEQNE